MNLYKFFACQELFEVIKMPKLLCPDCSQKISLDSDAVDNNDEMNCPKCDSLIIILKKGKKIKLKSAKQSFGFEDEEEEKYEEFEDTEVMDLKDDYY